MEQGRAWRCWILFLIVFFAGCAQQPERKRPNVILFTLDTFRPDRMRTYGGELDLTPNLDAFAANSIVFENAISPIGVTFPSHSTMFTGQYPGEHGVLWNDYSLPPGARTLAETLRSVGYQTAAFVSNLGMVCYGGLDQGFDVLSTADVPLCENNVRPGSETNQDAIKWLETQAADSGPYFMWIHYFDAHAPYAPTSYSEKEFSKLGYTGHYRDGATVEEFYAYKHGSKSNEERAAINILYDGHVKEVDENFRVMMDALKARGVLDNALVVVVADHGQSLGEHGFVGHGWITEECLRVPFIVQAMGIPGFPPRHESRRVSLVDLFSTILDFLGVPLPEANSSGKSLLQALQGEQIPERILFGTTSSSKDELNEKNHRLIVLYDKNWKLYLADDAAKLFDLNSDPAEERPIPEKSWDANLMQRLMPIAQKHQALEFRPGEKYPGVTPKKVINDLKELGYLR